MALYNPIITTPPPLGQLCHFHCSAMPRKVSFSAAAICRARRVRSAARQGKALLPCGTPSSVPRSPTRSSGCASQVARASLDSLRTLARMLYDDGPDTEYLPVARLVPGAGCDLP